MKTVFGLRSQFILLAFFCIAGTITITSYYIIERENSLLKSAASQQAMMLGASSATLFTNAFVYEEIGLIDSAAMEEYLEYYVQGVMAQDSRILSFMALDADSYIVTHTDLQKYGDAYEVEDFDAIMHVGKLIVRPISGESLEVLVPLVIESKKWGMCRIVFSLSEVQEAMKSLRLEVLGVASINLLVSLLLIGFAAEYFIRPLQKLSDAMEKITVEGDVSSPMPELSERKDEIGQLQHSFHWMTTRLQEEEKSRIQTRENLYHTEKMATVGALTASIAHEINNPLGGVILCFNNLCTGNLDEKGRRQHEEVIQQSLERMKKTMRDLLDYSRQSGLDMQVAAPQAVVEKSLGLVETMLRQLNIQLRLTFVDDLPTLLLDVAKIQQIIVNLVVNAAQAMEQGGDLKITVKKEKSGVLIVVSDSGAGIPQDLQQKIFDPFFTTKDVGKGTGLGLALSQSIAEQHGGRLLLLKSDGLGSSFALVLPGEEKIDG